MMRVGAIDNPHSHRNKQRASGLEAAAREVEGFCYAPLDDMADLPTILADLARKDLELLVISGGDGTVQAVLTELIEARPFEQLPTLAILPRGMTNMTASDIGIGGDKGLRRLFQHCRSGELSGHLHRRHLLRLENIRDYGPQVGMFFGGAGIYRAIETCRQSIHSQT
jgi:diacylglycerol kinase family enzyme